MAKKFRAKSGRQPSVMSHQFSQVPSVDIPRSSFRRSHGHKTTFDSGYLVPFYVDECLPGDTFNLNATMFARLATPIVPVMDNMQMETFYFAVPLRLVWDNFEKFMGQQDNPGDSTDFLIPALKWGPSGSEKVFGTHSLGDYFGLPVQTTMETQAINALFFRAYNLIWNEWFRDQNLQDSVVVHKGDGPDPLTDYKLLRRGKRHDYFTSALPWPQKGPGVELPLGGQARVEYDFEVAQVKGGVWRSNASGQPVTDLIAVPQTASFFPDNYGKIAATNSSPMYDPLSYDPNGSLIAE